MEDKRTPPSSLTPPTPFSVVVPALSIPARTLKVVAVVDPDVTVYKIVIGYSLAPMVFTIVAETADAVESLNNAAIEYEFTEGDTVSIAVTSNKLTALFGVIESDRY